MRGFGEVLGWKSDVLVRFWWGFGEVLVRFCCVSNITRIPPAMSHCIIGFVISGH